MYHNNKTGRVVAILVRRHLARSLFLFLFFLVFNNVQFVLSHTETSAFYNSCFFLCAKKIFFFGIVEDINIIVFSLNNQKKEIARVFKQTHMHSCKNKCTVAFSFTTTTKLWTKRKECWYPITSAALFFFVLFCIQVVRILLMAKSNLV